MVVIPPTEVASILEPNQTYLAIADSGHHRIVIINLQGEIQVIISLFIIFIIFLFKMSR